jgi:hypothetical protein
MRLSSDKLAGILTCHRTQVNKKTAKNFKKFGHRFPGAASGRNQTKRLKCKTQNFGIPASRDNSLLSKHLSQPCQKNTHKKQEVERLYYSFAP